MRHGNFDVQSILVGRNTIRTDILEWAHQARDVIKRFLVTPVSKHQIALTVDMTTDSLTRKAYLDVSASVVDVCNIFKFFIPSLKDSLLP